MQTNIFTTAAKRVTKLTDKAKAALEDKLEAAGPSKKRKISDANLGISAVSNNPKKAKQTPRTGTGPKDKPVSDSDLDEAALSPPGTAADPRKICRAVVRTEEEEAALYDEAIVINDESEKSESEAGDQTSGPESAEDERSMFLIYQITPLISNTTERLMKEWISPIYAFFDPTPHIVEVDGRRAHQFKCRAKRCKATIKRFLDKKDARSTGNMRKHVKSCWGEDTLNAADDAKDANEVRTKIVGGILKNGSITTSFERKGKGKVTYSHRQHTRAETK
jgi:hypothetical protein